MENFQIINENNNIINYDNNDLALLNPIEIYKEFGNENDIIELHITDQFNNILDSSYNYKNYINKNNKNNSKLSSDILLDPNKDLLEYGYSYGDYSVIYNFYKNLFGSSYINKFYIKDISFDRLELKISLLNSNFEDLSKKYVEYIIDRNEKDYYSDFILNFGENNIIIGVNILLDNNQNNSDLYIKLYKPLPTSINIKDTLWINEIIANPISYNLSKLYEVDDIGINSEKLKGPNFNIEINNIINTSTDYLNINNIIDASSSLNNQIDLLKDININIDFNELNNFIHFSSAYERLENFIYKIKKLENLNNDLNTITSLSGSILGSSLLNITKEINTTISNFDKFENYLYFESGSNCFPKSSSSKPYINQSISSIEVMGWLGSVNENDEYYGGKYLEFSDYDINNRDYLWNNLPEYIKLDEQNSQLKLFISMLGQHFDYLWIYIKDITNRHNNDNRLNIGISKDMIAETLKSFGIKLYTNSRNNNNIYLSLLGINEDGSFLPQTGSYVINNYITSSNYTIPDNDIQKEIYKRIYNNLPYLLKSKGTKSGLRALINCFGIPSTILSIKEFGGNIKEENYIENIIDKFNYSLNLNGAANLSIPFYPSNQQLINTGHNDINPDTIEFRFKLNSIIPSQSLLESNNNNKIIRIIHISNSLAEIDFGLEGNQGWFYSSPIQLPLYNNDWWNINLTRESGSLRFNQTGSNQNYTLTIGNKDEFGNTNIQSSSIFINGFESSSYNQSWVDSDIIFPGGSNINNPFSGTIQEFRYWINSIPQENFKDHILNPKSISYLNETGSFNNLIFRLPLGSELDNNVNNITSSHPSKIESFITDINNGISDSYATITNSQSVSFKPNYELYYINTPNLGLNTESNQKIKIIDNYILPDNTLSFFNKVSKVDINQSNNSKNIEISISPQNIINNDIIEQLGNFNIDNYIGDVKDKYKNKYPDLEKLKLFYFQKYINKYNFVDIIKLLSYFDNSLFKMIKDFIPATANLSSGLVIKSPNLERNKIQQFEPTLTQDYYEGDIKTSFISGSNPLESKFTTSNSSSITYIQGDIKINSDDNKELFNGEFGGSNIIIYKNKKIFEDNNSLFENIPIIELNPILNNIDEYKKSSKYLKADSNINFLTESLFFNKNNDIVKSDTQEYNYNIQRSLLPKYLGSKTISKEYNKYNVGDISYGKTSNIDYNNIYFGYFEEITSQSLTLPKRSNVYLKYLINGNGDITELSNNGNINLVQNIFNNKENINIILDNNQFPSKQKQLEGINTIYAGGYKLEPILQNLTTNISTDNNINFIFENDIQIINEDNNLITSSLSNNSLIIGNPILYPILTQNNPPNNFFSYDFKNNFNIKFPIQRNTPYPLEIRQKITGSIDIKINIKKFLDFKTKFYRNSNGSGQSWEVVGEYENTWLLDATFSDPLFNSVNKIRSVDVPSGAEVKVINGGNEISETWITSGFKNTTSTPSPFIGFIPLVDGNQGVDRVIIKSLSNLSFIYNLVSSRNDFGGNPSFINTEPNPVLLNENKEIILRFNIEGDIIIPEGAVNGEFYLQKTGTNINGQINSNIRISCTPLSGSLALSNPVYKDINLNQLNSPYYFTAPPEFIYITGAIDYGFNSGSSPINNWFFERENSLETGSIFNILVGSYWLSDILFENINNEITQITPDISELGYEPIDNYLRINKGDIFKFYNEDKKEFPIIFENEIIDIIYPQFKPVNDNSNNNRFIIKLKDEISNLSCIDYIESGSFSKKIQNFIILSKQENESNIIINNIKKTGQTSSGILIPENISKYIKPKIGNIIKQLKNQNLIK
jgi:hypothetical protein